VTVSHLHYSERALCRSRSMVLNGELDPKGESHDLTASLPTISHELQLVSPLNKYKKYIQRSIFSWKNGTAISTEVAQIYNSTSASKENATLKTEKKNFALSDFKLKERSLVSLAPDGIRIEKDQQPPKTKDAS
jgi:hypothetical protein